MFVPPLLSGTLPGSGQEHKPLGMSQRARHKVLFAHGLQPGACTKLVVVIVFWNFLHAVWCLHGEKNSTEVSDK